MDARVTSRTAIPLCVDLDGTLISTDTLWEGVILLVKQRPLLAFMIILWALRGKAVLKHEVAARLEPEPSLWPYPPALIAFLEEEKAKGRRLVLATGAPEKIAQAIAAHIGLFDGVLCSCAANNLTSIRKRDALVAAYGESGFDYIGNSRDDLAVFDAAGEVTVVSPDRAALQWQRAHDARLIGTPQGGWRTVTKAMRVHQWLKNTLIMVPLILTHDISNVSAIAAAVVAFFSFSLLASAVYILNDLSDLQNDRAHPKKRLRPFASGQLTLPFGVALAAALVAGSALLASFLDWQFGAVLVLYGATTTAYTFFFKRKLLVDVFALAGLYTLRIIAGAAATGMALSFWLLAFSLFFFLSLALVKRYVELMEAEAEPGVRKFGRGYHAVDFEMIGQVGLASAFAAALVLALYIDSDEVRELYAVPWILWPICPLVLYMVLRIWMLARRGEMDEDPVVFIMRDWRSQLVTACGAVLIVAATL